MKEWSFSLLSIRPTQKQTGISTMIVGNFYLEKGFLRPTMVRTGEGSYPTLDPIDSAPIVNHLGSYLLTLSCMMHYKMEGGLPNVIRFFIKYI